MLSNRNLFLSLGILLSVYSCKNEEEIDTPKITSFQTSEISYMGDSIPLSITALGNSPLSSLKISYFQDAEKISEHIIPTKVGGDFKDQILIPFKKDIDDGPAEIQVMVKNKNFDYSTVTIPIQVKRPKFPYLTLKTAYGDYRMNPVPGQEYQYEVTANFPSSKLSALIEAPAFGENGHAFYFGGSPIQAFATVKDSIPFQTITALGKAYTVTFNIKSFAATPFLKPSFGEIEFPDFQNQVSTIETRIKKNDLISIQGFTGISSWYIDPSFFAKNSAESYRFLAIDGQYRITADQRLKYIRIEPLDGNKLADFNALNKTGGVWVNGGVGEQIGSAAIERFGIPSMSDNPTLWNPEKNVAMAPLGNGLYQIKLIANQNLFQSNVSGSTAALSFYEKSRSFQSSFTISIAQNLYGSPGIPQNSGGSERFEIKAAGGNSLASMLSTVSNRSLGAGRTYVFTLDTKVSPAALSITLE